MPNKISSQTHLFSATIAVIDDSKFFLSMLKELIESHGGKAICFSDSNVALTQIPNLNIDIIITDFEMPDQNGIEVIKKIKNIPHMESIPIILLTSKTDEDLLISAISAGADSCVSKSDAEKAITSKIMAMTRLRNLHLELKKQHQMDATKSVIGTYKHELNNILTIALGRLEKLKREFPIITASDNVAGLEKSIDRILDVLKRLENLEGFEEKEYSGKTKILKIS